MIKAFPQAAPEAAFALRRRLRERLEAYERVCQSDLALAAWLGFRLYVPLCSPLGMNPVNTLLFLMLFLAVVLPICLALGSRFGKWLTSHLDF